MPTRNFIAFLVLSALSSVLAGESKVTHANVTEAAALVKAKKVVVVDVRTAAEYANGHIEGAKNVDFLEEKTFESNLAKLDKDQPVLVHCAAGGRSTKSLKVFEKLGFKNITHMDGGLNAWQSAGLPVKK